MNTKTITIYGTPIAQPRARATVFAGHARLYTPKHAVSEFKAAIRQEAGGMFSEPLSGPIGVSVECVFPRPKSMVWKTRPMPRAHHLKKPDVDNVLKAILDALKSIAWRDDTQVVVCSITKCIGAGDEQPRTEVQLWPF